MALSIFRTYTLVLAVLSVLSALVLDGVLLRYFWQPLANRLESHSNAPIRYPPGLRFMLTHAWGAQLVHQR